MGLEIRGIIAASVLSTVNLVFDTLDPGTRHRSLPNGTFPVPVPTLASRAIGPSSPRSPSTIWSTGIFRDAAPDSSCVPLRCGTECPPQQSGASSVKGSPGVPQQANEEERGEDCGEGGEYGTNMGVMDTPHLLSPTGRTPFTPDGDEAQPTKRTGEMRAP
ncbi:hypothetical protein CSOJ01_14263 [Colletotrichum sojae]|uniref:Uncharacterized protein n=1 Tax=Colletotrichum sojae TaxID=2175907 RepID=A0A8H6IR01_9PEZI|nr:hypothetical protein CSOJ01_14263 [Colletotrichum sojae]